MKSKSSARTRLCHVLFYILGAMLLHGCGGGIADPDDVGAVDLKLRVAPEVTIAEIAYDISGNGFHKAGVIGVEHSTLIAASIGGIPAGFGFTLSLTASDISGAGLTCQGSATFDIAHGATTLANVHLTCRVAPRTGSLLVNGTLNICPLILATGASPAEITVGHAIAISSEANDLDALPSALTYTWSSPTGSIAAPTSANTTFTCTAVGTASITLVVTDGDCEETTTMQVTCSMADEVVDMDAGTPPEPIIVINEIESSGGVPGDWVEIANAGDASADLSGYVFKDADDTHAYVIPNGTVLAAHAYLVIDEATFGFGLGTADSARLYDTTATIVDAHAWTAHAATTYGRCPDGAGPFGATTMATKGAANDCGSGMGAGLMFDPWPGASTVVAVDVAGTFGANLSDIAYEPGDGSDVPVLWAVQNNPSKLFRIVADGSTFAPEPGAWASGKTLRYPNGLGSPDAEGVTKAEWSSPAVYVAAERNNDVSGTSRLSILRFDTSTPGSEITATHEWDLTPEFAAVGANYGLEAIAWVPDTHLVAGAFTDVHTGASYVPGAYADHGTGVFFVGLEGSGTVHAFVLDHAGGDVERIATFSSGQAGVMALRFDRDAGYLYAHCDQACGNRVTALEVETTPAATELGAFVVRGAFDPPSTLGDFGYEGFAIGPEAECVGGMKPVFWADDAQTSGHALRRGEIPCGSYL